MALSSAAVPPVMAQPKPEMAPAVFVDKDGALACSAPYNADPDRIELRKDVGHALARLQRAGYRLVLVTHQPGIAHGLFGEEALPPLWAAIAAALAPHGAVLDAIYCCPHHPEGRRNGFARVCDCRMPAPGLLLRAASEHGIDLARSWLIGDVLDGVEAGHRAGCRCVLLDFGSETQWRDSPLRRPDRTAASFTEAVEGILSVPTRQS